MRRITLTLTDSERQALVSLAEVERRDPRDQGALLLRRALEKTGYLAPVNGKHSQRIEVTHGA